MPTQITSDHLLNLIRLGGDSRIDFLAVCFCGDCLPTQELAHLAQDIAAMANAGGGALILGVDYRSRMIAGMSSEHLNSLKQAVYEVCRDVLDPALSATITFLELPDSLGTSRLLLCVDVPRNLFVHKAPGGYFERIGSSKREMSPQALERLMQQRSQSRLLLFDEQPVPGTTPDTLDKELTDRFVADSEESPAELLMKMGLLCPGVEGDLACSVSGILIGTMRPDQWLHSGACIEAVHYADTELDSDQQVTSRRITGPLTALEAFEFVRGSMLRPATKEPARVERPSFSERAVFEGIVNAVVHRDYSMAGAKIRIFIFRDRLEIFSPGALPNTLTIETIPHRQYTRNETLVSLLGRLTFEINTPDAPIRRGRFMEARGEGVPIILREARKLGAPEPLYELFDDQELKLTIFAQADG